MLAKVPTAPEMAHVDISFTEFSNLFLFLIFFYFLETLDKKLEA